MDHKISYFYIFPRKSIEFTYFTPILSNLSPKFLLQPRCVQMKQPSVIYSRRLTNLIINTRDADNTDWHIAQKPQCFHDFVWHKWANISVSKYTKLCTELLPSQRGMSITISMIIITSVFIMCQYHVKLHSSHLVFGIWFLGFDRQFARQQKI
jgi:hypothetical protein